MKKQLCCVLEPNKLDELLHPVFDEKSHGKAANVLARGLPASPGAATGQLVFHADEANKFPVTILARIETSPEDLEGMDIAKGILTAKGGMTSHAAVVARGMGKCCVSGAGDCKIIIKPVPLTVSGITFKEGDWISLNGSTGEVYEGKIATIDPEFSGDFGEVMELADKYRTMIIAYQCRNRTRC
jgi:pyruvate, orthophosphate dikinase